MPTTIARVTPVDYDAWHEMHMNVMREHGRAAGMISEVIYRDHDDPRTLVVVQGIESVDRIKEFLASPFMQETIAKAPIEGPPTFWFVDEVETIDIAGASS